MATERYGRLDTSVQQELITHIQHMFPPPIPSQQVVELALNALNNDARILEIIAIVTAIIGGAGLFVAIEGQFDIIYQIRTRGLIQQYMMALGMLLVFVLLAPLTIFADFVPTLVHSFVQTTPLGQNSGNLSFSDILATFCGLFATWVLVEIMYLIVPNQRISFRDSWFGALLATVAIQAYLQLFPFYATHFLSGYTGTVGFAIIFVFFFYFLRSSCWPGQSSTRSMHRANGLCPITWPSSCKISQPLRREVKQTCKSNGVPS